jgi:hypothetical protein
LSFKCNHHEDLSGTAHPEFAVRTVCRYAGGGQVWALTGLVPAGIATAVVTGGLLGAGVRPMLKRLAPGRRFFGEYQGELKEGDFGEVG